MLTLYADVVFTVVVVLIAWHLGEAAVSRLLDVRWGFYLRLFWPHQHAWRQPLTAVYVKEWVGGEYGETVERAKYECADCPRVQWRRCG